MQPEEPTLDFSAPFEIVHRLAEGERLAYGYLFNPRVNYPCAVCVQGGNMEFVFQPADG